MQYQLDTNAVIHFFKGSGRVADRMLAVPPSEVAISALVAYELRAGVEKSPQATLRRQQLLHLLNTVEIIAFDAATAQIATKIQAALEHDGQGIGPIDVLIAATALARGATLVTHNTKEFSRVVGLSVVDWHG